MSWTEEDYTALMRERGQTAFKEAEKAAKPSKQKNERIVIDGIKFDSKREGHYYQQLKLREKAGQISGLQLQVVFPLYVPVLDENGIHSTGMIQQASEYRADYVYRDEPSKDLHIVDAKGHRTKEYIRSKKWLFLQSGIVIEEV